MSGLPDMYTLSPAALGLWVYECTWYNYYVTLSFYANGFTIFIVVLIAFDCGFRL